MQKLLSPQKLDANRRNALKSTGPKTPQGRAVSKMNALKHGILSTQVLVRGFNIKESDREFFDLHERFRQEFNPVGTVEEMLVDQIVTTHWRLRRVLQAESGEIASSVDHNHWERHRPDSQMEVLLWAVSSDTLSAMQTSTLGIAIIQGWLRDLLARVQKEGELTQAAINDAFVRKGAYLKRFENLQLKLSQRPKGDDAAAWREENRELALDFIRREFLRLEDNKRTLKKREAANETALQSAALLPPAQVLDKIVRYETKLERQLYRAMNQLERLQRMRRGEAVPAPINLEVSDRP
jgi:hypothetical protein